MINNKKELDFYIMADRIMNNRPFKDSFKERILDILSKNPRIILYLRYMRLLYYYENKPGLFYKFLSLFYKRLYKSLEQELGIHLDESVFGYGVMVPHNCSIRIGRNNQIGKFAVIQSQTFMTGSNCIIGDSFYLSVGSKVIGPLKIGDNVSVAACSLVRKSCGNNVLLAGVPACIKKENYPSWHERDGDVYKNRIRQVETLKNRLGLYYL